MEPILAGKSVSISALKTNPSAAIEAAGGEAVAVLNRNTPAAYLVPAKAWEELMERLEDLELAEIARERANEKPVRVNLADL
ncbi:MAG: type II toxin-antitoxin system prevent-host-death family antitoxin [Pseudomonadota bacterium]|nr:type II toxin-antitoxin system prevent-host-death family antitoxin [Pseudomonadota bacterium]